MKKYKQALVIGRFDPLCKNHLDLFKQGREIAETLLIGVGVPNYERARQVLDKKKYEEYLLKDLLSYERKKQFIETALGGNNKHIVPIQDIFDKKRYAKHVINCFAEQGIILDNCVLIGENQYTYECFRGTKIDIVVAKDRTGYHATDARREIMEKGHSNKLACDLTNVEMKRIARNQRKLDKK
jgi:nicotinamide mononucleotide adenylyltransferase